MCKPFSDAHMERTERNVIALAGASMNAQRAFDAIYAEGYASVPEDEKVVWAMAALIHCDICRLVVAFDECEREGIARLVWMAEIVSKLFEAKRWYLKLGGKLLLDIARRRKCGTEYMSRQLKEIWSRFPIKQIESYAVYRNTVGYHYDKDTLRHLERFGGEDADLFYDRLLTFVRFSGAWAQLTRDLLRDELPFDALEEER